MKVYLVGGAVRDKLLKRKVVEHDWVVVGATPDQLLSKGYKQVGKDFPVFLHPETKDEYALARTERKQGSGYYGFQCYFAPDVTLEQDLERRDLTINAMAEDDAGNIVDPFGGQKDIEEQKLRHVSMAFVEDPLRVLRVARFAARYAYLGFTVADETLSLMRQLAESGELHTLTPERVWKETEKALSERSPQVYFQVLHQTRALKSVFPELDCLWGIPNPIEWHPEIDSGIHTMMVLEQAARLSTSIDVRFAALCHDLGKGLTPSSEWPSHKGHEKAGIDVIKSMCLRLKIPNRLNKLACQTSEYHLHSHKAFELDSDQLVSFMEKTSAYQHPDNFERLLLACEADFRGRTGFEEKDYPQRKLLQDILQATKTINADEWLKQGITGKHLGEKIHQHRVRIASELRQNWR